jgi:assimilatory nitrate reductase catalytic subunit
MDEARETRTTCPYCGVGCGVIAAMQPDGSASVRGDPDHPANFGRLCSKGMALGQTMGMDGRLLRPEIDGRPASWDAALDEVAARFSATIAEHGPDAVAFYISGQLLTEDYYVANKLMKGFIGTANIDTNSRLCMASSVAGHKRAFGEDVVPGTYDDFDCADLIVLVGSNAAWCHPILFQRMRRAQENRGTKIVTIDPRRTVTAEESDLHLAIDPGADATLFNGLLAHLVQQDLLDRRFIAERTNGFEAACDVAGALRSTPADSARACGLDAKDVAAFFELFARTPRTITVYSQGVNQSASGTDKVNAIINCHLATGRIGKPGMGPFSVTGQPNAMGGREVGGLANQLAAHMDFNSADIDRVSRFWRAPNIATRPGLKAVDLFDAVADGRIKALWIMGTNPAVSMPNAGHVRRALKTCPLVVVSDITRTDTTRYANILLPAAGWGEKDGTVTNSERRISRQRSFAAMPGEARADWRIICEVAGRMGFVDAFAFETPADIFQEHAALSAFENEGRRRFDIGALRNIDADAYQNLQPRFWPMPEHGEAQERLFGGDPFPTPGGRANFVPVANSGVATPVNEARPIGLNSGRLRDHWHTMTRTGRVALLSSNTSEPELDLSPADAARLELHDGDIVEAASAYGTARAQLRVTDAQKPGTAFLAMHWSGQFAARSSAGLLSSPRYDPVSGQPELKHVPVSIRKLDTTWTAIFLTRRYLTLSGYQHWSRQAVEGGFAYRLCGDEPAAQGALLARALLDPAHAANRIEYLDRCGRSYRIAATTDDGILAEALIVASPRKLPDEGFLLSILAAGLPLSATERLALLAGRAVGASKPKGRIVCACFGVDEPAIAEAASNGADNLDAIGATLKAGTNCGSCRSEIKRILNDRPLQAAE